MRILLVEDNPGDVRLMKEALRECQINIDLDCVIDGEEAILYMRKEGKYGNAPTPDLVLLDLNLPKKDGREVLKVIKFDEATRRIPVLVLTTSRAENDIRDVYDLHANCYLNKPVDFDNFVELIKKIEDYWFNIAMLSTPSRV